ncbi:MAG: hypothetical protein JRE40_06035 [Deltaproteobacteria bacterium]|nr:hypothetical protein [Deltaproteobacteria bacterium]
MRKMMKIWITVVIALAYLGGSQTALWAATTVTGTPVIYQITLHQIRVYNQDNGTWYVAGTGDLTFDIASTGAGTAVGNYISGASLATGTYTQVEVTMSRTFGIKAVILDTPGTLGNSNSYYNTTATSTSGAINCLRDGTPPFDGVGYATGTAVIPSGATLPATERIEGDYLIHTETLTTNIIVKEGETRTIRVSFDITNSATFEQVVFNIAVCYPSPPAITITQIE